MVLPHYRLSSKIFLLLQDGRLGNQIFQFFAALEHVKGSTLILLGYSDIKLLFDLSKPNHIYIPSFLDFILKLLNPIRHRYRYLRKIPGPLLSLTTEQPRFSQALPSYPFSSTSFKRPFHLFHNIFGLHQDFHPNRLLQSTQISPTFSRMATNWLSIQQLDVTTTAFIHIRLGDFQTHSIGGHSFVMPASYYKKAFKYLSTYRLVGKLIVFTDASNWDEVLPFIPVNAEHVIPGPSNSLLAWSVMNYLRFGILSASTFSLSAALVNLDSKHNHLFIRPSSWPSAGIIHDKIPRDVYFDGLVSV